MKPYPHLARLMFGCLLSSGLIMGNSLSLRAQTATDLDPLKDFRSDTVSDPFSNRTGDNSGLFNLIHRAMQGQTNVDPTAVSIEQRQNVDDAAAAFRARQQQLLQKTNTSPIPVLMVPAPAVTAPATDAIPTAPTATP
ncbi:hypothetical protein ACN4EG_07145 [Alkalinema pantanalense CENA528]|uniref:hypothetical protein n=1 Tax=Alkalinema pantanalense TaxID=1620705 RepID=UPI003D6F2F13